MRLVVLVNDLPVGRIPLNTNPIGVTYRLIAEDANDKDILEQITQGIIADKEYGDKLSFDKGKQTRVTLYTKYSPDRGLDLKFHSGHF